MSKYSSTLSFVDLLFNLLLAFVCLFILSFLLINPQNDSGKIDPNAEFMIVLDWDDSSRDDIDLWVQDPEENVVSFAQREDGLMHLDRDARGTRQRMVEPSGGQIGLDNNQEIVSIRGFLSGEYVVNVHGYSVYDAPVEVSVQVIKLNPYGLVCERKVQILRNGQEDTICRFELDSSGRVISTSELPRRIFGRGR